MLIKTLSSKPSSFSLSDTQKDSASTSSVVVVKPAHCPTKLPSPRPFASDTTPFVVPSSFQFFASDKHQAPVHHSSMSFAASPTDYAYLHLEVICAEPSAPASFSRSRLNSDASFSSTYSHHQPSVNSHIDLDLICWKIIVTKAMSQHLGLSGTAIPTDVIHIINPPRYQRNKTVIGPFPLDKRRRPQRRYLSANGSQSSLSDAASDTSPDPSYPDIVYKNKPNSRRSSVSSNNQQDSQSSQAVLQQQQPPQLNPQAWIRVPESELTNAWTGLSGFATTVDTGNYGTISVGIRVIRASRYMPSVSGPLRNKW